MTSQHLKRVSIFDQQRHVTLQLEKGSFGQRQVFNGDYYQQFFGLLAQTLVADMLGEARPEWAGTADQGYDLVINGVKVDVKCVMRNGPPKMSWACNVPASQLKYECDAYMFVSYDKTDGIFHFVGWIPKNEFLLKATRHEIGSTITRDDGTLLVIQHMPLYDIPMRKLRKIKSAEDIRSIRLTKSGKDTPCQDK